MITTDAVVKNLVRIAEVLALEPCEATTYGQEPCPVQYDDQEG